METKHVLQKVLSPRKFLSKDQKQIPRYDSRKENLRREIVFSLATAHSYQEFENAIKNKGYDIIKARGISFLDPKKVKVKGSEVGYSLQKIEKLLTLHPKMRAGLIRHNEEKHYKEQAGHFNKSPDQHSTIQANLKSDLSEEKKQLEEKLISESGKHSHILDLLLKAERMLESIDPNFLPKKKSLTPQKIQGDEKRGDGYFIS